MDGRFKPERMRLLPEAALNSLSCSDSQQILRLSRCLTIVVISRTGKVLVGASPLSTALWPFEDPVCYEDP
jgi:hypothetical protein